MTQDLSFISYPLPDDIRQLYESGRFMEMNRLIDLALAQNTTPQVMRRRLEFAKICAEDIQSAYQLTEEEAMTEGRERIPDLTAEEFAALTDSRTLDWHYIDGIRHYRNNCIHNLLVTSPTFAMREKDRSTLQEQSEENAARSEMMHTLKEKGSVTLRSTLEESITITSNHLQPGETLRIWLPLPVHEMPVTHSHLDSASHPPLYIAPENTPQRTAYFEVSFENGMTVSARITWDNFMPCPALHPDEATPDLPSGDIQEQDLSEMEPHIRFTPFLRDLTREIVGTQTNPLLKARAIYDFITQRCVYRFMPAYRAITDIPEYFCANQRGDCGVQALTFITMCRIAGIPARWQSGLYTAPVSSGMHDWARFYVAPYGWLFADCSFGGSAHRAGDRERHDFYFGHLDPWRLPFASDFQQTFDPPSRFMRYDPYDNQCGEVESLLRRLHADEFDHNRKLISAVLL